MATKTYININGQNVDGSIATPDRKFRDAWFYDGNVVSVDPLEKAKIMTRLVKTECGERIAGAAPDYTQRNMVVAAMFSDSDKVLLGKWNTWVSDMKSACSSLIAADDQDYANYAKWPVLGDDVKAFIDAN
jgi:hypothetical protein